MHPHTALFRVNMYIHIQTQPHNHTLLFKNNSHIHTLLSKHNTHPPCQYPNTTHRFIITSILRHLKKAKNWRKKKSSNLLVKFNSQERQQKEKLVPMATNTWRHQQQTHPHLKANCMLCTDIVMSEHTHPAGVGDAGTMRTALAGAGVAVRDVGRGRAALQGRGLVGREGMRPAGRVSHGGWRRHRRGGKGTGPCGREGGRHVGSILSSCCRHLTNR